MANIDDDLFTPEPPRARDLIRERIGGRRAVMRHPWQTAKILFEVLGRHPAVSALSGLTVAAGLGAVAYETYTTEHKPESEFATLPLAEAQRKVLENANQVQKIYEPASNQMMLALRKYQHARERVRDYKEPILQMDLPPDLARIKDFLDAIDNPINKAPFYRLALSLGMETQVAPENYNNEIGRLLDDVFDAGILPHKNLQLTKPVQDRNDRVAAAIEAAAMVIDIARSNGGLMKGHELNGISVDIASRLYDAGITGKIAALAEQEQLERDGRRLIPEDAAFKQYEAHLGVLRTIVDNLRDSDRNLTSNYKEILNAFEADNKPLTDAQLDLTRYAGRNITVYTDTVRSCIAPLDAHISELSGMLTRESERQKAIDAELADPAVSEERRRVLEASREEKPFDDALARQHLGESRQVRADLVAVLDIAFGSSGDARLAELAGPLAEEAGALAVEMRRAIEIDAVPGIPYPEIPEARAQELLDKYEAFYRKTREIKEKGLLEQFALTPERPYGPYSIGKADAAPQVEDFEQTEYLSRTADALEAYQKRRLTDIRAFEYAEKVNTYEATQAQGISVEYVARRVSALKQALDDEMQAALEVAQVYDSVYMFAYQAMNNVEADYNTVLARPDSQMTRFNPDLHPQTYHHPLTAVFNLKSKSWNLETPEQIRQQYIEEQNNTPGLPHMAPPAPTGTLPTPDEATQGKPNFIEIKLDVLEQNERFNLPEEPEWALNFRALGGYRAEALKGIPENLGNNLGEANRASGAPQGVNYCNFTARKIDPTLLAGDVAHQKKDAKDHDAFVPAGTSYIPRINDKVLFSSTRATGHIGTVRKVFERHGEIYVTYIDGNTVDPITKQRGIFAHTKPLRNLSDSQHNCEGFINAVALAQAKYKTFGELDEGFRQDAEGMMQKYADATIQRDRIPNELAQSGIPEAMLLPELRDAGRVYSSADELRKTKTLDGVINGMLPGMAPQATSVRGRPDTEQSKPRT